MEIRMVHDSKVVTFDFNNPVPGSEVSNDEFLRKDCSNFLARGYIEPSLPKGPWVKGVSATVHSAAGFPIVHPKLCSIGSSDRNVKVLGIRMRVLNGDLTRVMMKT